MRPDRLVVGEVRGARGDRAAAGAQHRSRRLVVHHPRQQRRRRARADSRRWSCSRPGVAARRGARHVRRAVDVVVHVVRRADGSRRVVEVGEVVHGPGRRGAAVRSLGARRHGHRRTPAGQAMTLAAVAAGGNAARVRRASPRRRCANVGVTRPPARACAVGLRRRSGPGCSTRSPPRSAVGTASWWHGGRRVRRTQCVAPV